MFSTPLICCSSGAATVSPITVGLAPGYVVRTTTVGGTTSGYSLSGRRKYASAPITKMTIEITAAKIGRLMKNVEIFMTWLPRASVLDGAFSGSSVGVRRHLAHGHSFWRHRRAGTDTLQTADHDHVALVQSSAKHAEPVGHRPNVHCAIFRLVLFT